MTSPRIAPILLLFAALGCSDRASTTCGADADCFRGEVCDRAARECVPAGSLDMTPERDMATDLDTLDALDSPPDLTDDQGIPDAAPDADDAPDLLIDEPDLAISDCPFERPACGGVCVPPPVAGVLEATCVGSSWQSGGCRPGYDAITDPNDATRMLGCQARGLGAGVVGAALTAPLIALDGDLDAFGRVHLIAADAQSTRYIFWDGEVNGWRSRDLGHKARAVSIGADRVGAPHMLLLTSTELLYLRYDEVSDELATLPVASVSADQRPDIALSLGAGSSEPLILAWIDGGGRPVTRRTDAAGVLGEPTTYARAGYETLEIEPVLDSVNDVILFTVERRISAPDQHIVLRYEPRSGAPVKLWEGALSARSLHALNRSAMRVSAFIDDKLTISDGEQSLAQTMPDRYGAWAGASAQVGDSDATDMLAYVLDEAGLRRVQRLRGEGAWSHSLLYPGDLAQLTVFGPRQRRWATFVDDKNADLQLRLLRLDPP